MYSLCCLVACCNELSSLFFFLKFVLSELILAKETSTDASVHNNVYNSAIHVRLATLKSACCVNWVLLAGSAVRPRILFSVILTRPIYLCVSPLPSTRQHPNYGDCLEVETEYYQNCSVLDCVTQCSQSAAHLYEQFLQLKLIGFVTLGPLCCV